MSEPDEAHVRPAPLSTAGDDRRAHLARLNLLAHAEAAREREDRQASAARTAAREAARQVLGPLHPGPEGDELADQVADAVLDAVLEPMTDHGAQPD